MFSIQIFVLKKRRAKVQALLDEVKADIDEMIKMSDTFFEANAAINTDSQRNLIAAIAKYKETQTLLNMKKHLQHWRNVFKENAADCQEYAMLLINRGYVLQINYFFSLTKQNLPNVLQDYCQIPNKEMNDYQVIIVPADFIIGIEVVTGHTDGNEYFTYYKMTFNVDAIKEYFTMLNNAPVLGQVSHV